MSWHRVAEAGALAHGAKRLAAVGGRELLLCRVGDAFFAVASRCTHSAWPLADEPLEGFELVCSLHGARFDVRDGCPSAGPASKPLDTYRVEVREDDLWVELPT